MAFETALGEFDIAKLVALRQNKTALIKRYQEEIKGGSKRLFPRVAVLKLRDEIDVIDRELKARGHTSKGFKKLLVKMFR